MSPAPEHAALVRACTAPTALLDAQGRVLAANPAFARRPGLDAGARLADLGPGMERPQAVDHGGPLATGIAGGHLHVRPLDPAHWLAQWLEAPVDPGAEQRQLQMFADTVAHDLRAPLRSIESFAKLLDERAASKLDAAERMHLSRIRAAVGRMSGLLSALGELSRAASAAMQPSDVDLSLLAEWAIAELHDAEPERDVVVHVQPGLHATGDERLLRQMLRELLGNAWTFTRKAAQAVIDVRGERVGDRLRVSIRDTGVGFDMQYAHKLFQPFQRLHGAEQGAGHGLGLAIAQRIAQRHGGGVTAESVEGQGSTFIVELPVANGE
ncbi:MAG TPA: HAMP domain-containing sensor histidine kinase [Lysobacter sp.]|nr:HAMP domain-containing sensor histidine kinase [Lysobacter sp.]